MRTLAMDIIGVAAQAAGLSQERVMSVSAKDNLTLPRPRLEIDFLPETLARTGRRLAVNRSADTQTTKKELYEIRFDVTAHVFADDEAWLYAFEYAFVAALPNGVNDARGNWVRIRASKATFKTPPAKRVGEGAIKVFEKVDTLFLITLTGRVTHEEEQTLITTFEITAPKLAQGSNYGEE